MPCKVEIINIALARLGESPIQSPEEDSVPAITAKTVYDAARRATLRDYNWNFALITASLAQYGEPEHGFRFAFALPADCLRAVRLIHGERFAIRSGALVTNAPKAVLEYVRDVTDESEFDDKFVEAFSYKLASELAMPVKGSAELMASYSNAYQALVNRAATETAWEQRDLHSVNPYLEARF